MSVYLEFPSIQDYPVYCPLEKIVGYLSCWTMNVVEVEIDEEIDTDLVPSGVKSA